MKWATPEQKREQYRLVLDRYNTFFRDSLDDAVFMGMKPVLRGLRYSQKAGGNHTPFIIATEGNCLRGYIFCPGTTANLEGMQEGLAIRFSFSEEDGSPFRSVRLDCSGKYVDECGVFIGTWRRTPENGHENGGILVAETLG